MTENQKRRFEDRIQAKPLDWDNAQAEQSSTAGAAKGGNTSDNGSQASSVLTDERIVQVWQNMPGGPNGWLKEFGYLQFARAIESEVLAQAGVRAEPALTSLEFTAELDRLLGCWANAIETGFTSHEAIREKIVSFIREAAQVPAKKVRAQALREAADLCMRVTPDRAKVRSIGEAAHYAACRDAIRSLAQSSTADKASEVRAAEWISVEDRLPERPESQHCLATYRNSAGKLRIIRAMYVRQFEVEATGDECDSETNEADDREYLKAGWLECIDNWGEYSSVYVTEGPVTHWMPLPAAPSTAVSGNTSALGEGAEA